MLSVIAMFGGLGLPEIIIIFIVLLILAAPVLLIIFFVSKMSKKNQSRDHNKRLQELQKMKEEGLITQDEFEKKRQQILNDI